MFETLSVSYFVVEDFGPHFFKALLQFIEVWHSHLCTTQFMSYCGILINLRSGDWATQVVSHLTWNTLVYRGIRWLQWLQVLWLKTSPNHYPTTTVLDSCCWADDFLHMGSCALQPNIFLCLLVPEYCQFVGASTLREIGSCLDGFQLINNFSQCRMMDLEFFRRWSHNTSRIDCQKHQLFKRCSHLLIS